MIKIRCLRPSPPPPTHTHTHAHITHHTSHITQQSWKHFENYHIDLHKELRAPPDQEARAIAMIDGVKAKHPDKQVWSARAHMYAA